MPYLCCSAALMQRISLLQKHSSKVYVNKDSISSSNICLISKNISDAEFALLTKDFCELLKEGVNFEIEDDMLFYSQQYTVGNVNGTMCKKFDLIDLRYDYKFGSPLSTLKIGKFLAISSDKTLFTFVNGKVILESYEYVRTRVCHPASKIDGTDSFQLNVKGTDLKIINEIEDEKIISFYGDFIVVFALGNTVTAAIIIRETK